MTRNFIQFNYSAQKTRYFRCQSVSKASISVCQTNREKRKINDREAGTGQIYAALRLTIIIFYNPHFNLFLLGTYAE